MIKLKRKEIKSLNIEHYIKLGFGKYKFEKESNKIVVYEYPNLLAKILEIILFPINCFCYGYVDAINDIKNPSTFSHIYWIADNTDNNTKNIVNYCLNKLDKRS